MKRLVSVMFITPIACVVASASQQSPAVYDDPAFDELFSVGATSPAAEVINNKNTPFTLPKPTKWRSTRGERNVIMCAIKNNPQYAAVWREEYKYIYESIGDTRSWTLGILRRSIASASGDEIYWWKAMIEYIEHLRRVEP